MPPFIAGTRTQQASLEHNDYDNNNNIITTTIILQWRRLYTVIGIDRDHCCQTQQRGGKTTRKKYEKSLKRRGSTRKRVGGNGNRCSKLDASSIRDMEWSRHFFF